MEREGGGRLLRGEGREERRREGVGKKKEGRKDSGKGGWRGELVESWEVGER